VRERSGEPPVYCGGDTISPFTAEDLDVDTVSTLNYSRTLRRTAGVGVTADLVGALSEAGVSGAVLNRARAELQNGWNNALTRTLTTQGRFVTAVLKPQVIARLRATQVPARYTACAKQLRDDPNLRLVNGISGAHVAAAANRSELRDSILASLQASLSSAGVAAATIAEVSPRYQRTIETGMEKAINEAFSVLVMTFYQPDRRRR
jgi:hypothetical protein